MDSARFVQLILELVSPEPRSREEAAEHAVDLRATFRRDEAAAVAIVLAHLSVAEANAKAREASLHALAELFEWSLAPGSVADIVSVIDPTTLVGSEVEYVACIRGPQAEHTGGEPRGR